jgi:hypothetical protein
MTACAFVMVIVTGFTASPPVGCYETAVACSTAVRETLMLGPTWSKRFGDAKSEGQFRVLCIPAK